MRCFLAILLFPLLLQPAFAAEVELPEWDDPTGATGYILGGGLWPKGLGSEEGSTTAPPAVGGAVAADGTATVSTPGAVQFYGPQGVVEGGAVPPGGRPPLIEKPDGTFVVPQVAVEEEAYEPLPPIEGELKDLYFSYAPVDFLIDPQRLLTEQKSNDIKRFLEFHSDESKFRIYVMALGEDQKIPADIDVQALHKKWFSDSPTVLMLYYREKPQLTQLVFNESVRDSLPKSVFDRILQNCLREGGMTELAPDQVEKMAIELSIQLYWLSRLMESENKDERSIAAASSVHELMASSDAPELLREYAPGIFIDDSSKVISLIFTAVVILGCLAVLGLIGWIILWWKGRENVSGEPLLFPEFTISPRLGGEFSGGGFVGMSFELGEGAT